MFELDMMNFDQDKKQAIKYMKLVKKELLQIVEPFFSEELDPKKQSELSHLAKFILSYDKTISILRLHESPDFIIFYQNKNIGVEVRQLLTKRAESIRYIQKLFDDAAKAYKQQFPQEKVHVNFHLAEGFNYKKREKGALINFIVDYVHNELNKISSPVPPFIKSYDLQPYSDVSFSYNDGAYSAETLLDEVVLESIEDKEAKIEDYIAASGTEKQWLLLVNKEAGSNSFDTEDFDGNLGIETKFEHIFLLKDFDMQFVEIK